MHKKFTRLDLAKLRKKKSKNKYGVSSKNERTWFGDFDGVKQNIVFDSKKEMRRFCELRLLQRTGRITDLVLQKRFLLLDKLNDERAIHYRADFVYKNKNGENICEDVKGFRTTEYILKRKMFKAKYPDIIFIEV
jgi:hypothetical protein